MQIASPRVVIISMRKLVALAVLAACGPRPTATPPLVPLTSGPAPLPAAAALAPGEAMEWDIYWQGLLVGHADLDVAAAEAHSRFSTTALARTFAKVHYSLTTTLEHQLAVGAREAIEMPGDRDSVVAAIDGAHYALDDGPRLDVPGGSSLHTLHTALGSIRTWSRGPSRPAYLWFVLGHTLYRLDVTPPTRDDAQGHRALRIAATIRAVDHSLDADLTIWLAATPDRTPLRFVVNADGQRVSAELTATTARL